MNYWQKIFAISNQFLSIFQTLRIMKFKEKTSKPDVLN